MTVGRRTLIVLLLATCACRSGLPFTRPNLKDYREHFERPSTGELSAVFLGAASLLFTDGANAILTDPFVTRPREELLGSIGPDEGLIKQTIAHLGVSTIDAVATGHSHYDHAMDAAVFAQLTKAVLLGSDSTMKIGLGADPPPKMDEVSDGASRDYGKFRISFIESKHSDPVRFPGDIVKVLRPPQRVGEWKVGKVWSIHIQHESGSLLVHGGAHFVPGALAKIRADVVYLGIGALGKQSEAFVEEYWNEVVRATHARRVILIHWDDFFRPLGKPLRPMVSPIDKFDVTLQRLRRCGATDGVGVLLPVTWQATDPFHGLTMPAPPWRAPTAPHPCTAER